MQLFQILNKKIDAIAMCTLNFFTKRKVKLEKILKKQVKRILNLFLYLRISNLKKKY